MANGNSKKQSLGELMVRRIDFTVISKTEDGVINYVTQKMDTIFRSKGPKTDS